MRVFRFVLCCLFRLCLFLGSAKGGRELFFSLGLLSLRFRRCLLPFCGVSRRAIVFLVLPYFQLHTSILILQGSLLEERGLLLANPTYVHHHKTYVERVYKCSIINLISYKSYQVYRRILEILKRLKHLIDFRVGTITTMSVP